MIEKNEPNHNILTPLLIVTIISTILVCAVLGLIAALSESSTYLS